MSVQGVIRFRGARCDVFRPVKVDGAGGLPTVTWPLQPVARDTRVFLDVITEELAQSLFGQSVPITVRGAMFPTVGVLVDDGLVVRTGSYTGQRFKVTAIAPPQGRPGAAYIEAALEATPEVFG